MLSDPRHPISTEKYVLHSRSFGFALEKAVSKCKKRLFFACYVLTGNENRSSDPVITILKKCIRLKAEKDVDVRFAIDLPKKNRPNWNCNHHFMRYLQGAGIPFRVPASTGTLHAKLILVDSSHLFVGSHNLAMSSIFNPYELTVEFFDGKFIDMVAQDYVTWWLTLRQPVTLPGV